jgi:lysophosphatidate acyltransferase
MLLIVWSGLSVLPPVSTEGLTSSDVTELAASVRGQMLHTLREISVKVPSGEPPSESEDKTPTPAIMEPSLPSSASISSMSGTLPSIGTEEANEGGNGGDSESHSVSGSDFSLRRESSGAGTETEEEEGMVIIERPV